MIQPPKMSPLALTSAGSGITRSTSCEPSVKVGGAIIGPGSGVGIGASCGLSGDNRVMSSPHNVAATLSVPSGPAPATQAPPRSDWGTLAKLLPYLWRYRWRVGIALAFLIAAKGANVSVPVLLKYLIDALSIKPGDPTALLVVPAGLLVAYGALRLSTSLFTELRELIFAKATEGTARSISLQVFRHLHALSLRFHLERQTGGMTRDIERGTRAVHSLIS